MQIFSKAFPHHADLTCLSAWMTMLIFTKHPSALPSAAIFRSASEDQAPFRALKQGLCSKEWNRGAICGYGESGYMGSEQREVDRASWSPSWRRWDLEGGRIGIYRFPLLSESRVFL